MRKLSGKSKGDATLPGAGRRGNAAVRHGCGLTVPKKHVYDVKHIIIKADRMHKNYMRSLPREWRAMAKVFVALGDEHRQRLLLTFEKGERLTVGQISQVSTLSRPAVSHHLKILRAAGILEAEKSGKEVFLRVNKALIEQTLRTVLDYVREQA
jgi:DNA-binding transcriptional ArsR family regulator